MDFETFTQDVSTFRNVTQQNTTTVDVNGTDADLAKAVRVGRRLSGSADDWPSEVVKEPGEIPSSGHLLVACTQLDLKAGEQRKLVDRWCEALPSFRGLRHLYFRSRVPQRLFDAACQVPGLESLYIKWSGVKTLEAIERASTLRDLVMGSSASLQSIEPLRGLSSLKSLELENTFE